MSLQSCLNLFHLTCVSLLKSSISSVWSCGKAECDEMNLGVSWPICPIHAACWGKAVVDVALISLIVPLAHLSAGCTTWLKPSPLEAGWHWRSPPMAGSRSAQWRETQGQPRINYKNKKPSVYNSVLLSCCFILYHFNIFLRKFYFILTTTGSSVQLFSRF